MRRGLVIGCAVFSAAAVIALQATAQAQGQKSPSPSPPQVVPEKPLGPPPQPAETPAEPAVRIPIQEGDKVEEYREGGRIVMLRVTPRKGPVYYLLDTSGRGDWVRRDTLDPGLHVPMWTIFTWD